MSADNTKILDLLDPKFPLVYKGILPKDTHFQMTKSRLSRECCICERPFSVFFWRINGIPYKTYICQICAKSANVCQVSLLDLDIGIPVIVRNKLLHIQQEDFKSSTRRWYTNRLLDRRIENGQDWLDLSLHEKVINLDPVIVKRVQQFVDADPYLSFKKAPVCPQWLTNECTHGLSCYYAHELPGPGEHSPDWSKFGVRCRYLGTVDPNGQAIIEKLLLIDQQMFQNKEQQNQKEEKEKEKERSQRFFSDSKKDEKPKQPMKAPTENRIFDFDEPLEYEGINIDLSLFPKFINGRLQL